MKLKANDEIRQVLINDLIVDIKAATSLTMTLHNTNNQDVPDEETIKPGNVVVTKTIDTDNIFYAVRASEAHAVPTDNVLCILDETYYHMSATYESSVGFNSLYITTVVENNSGSAIEYDKVVLEAIGINITGSSKDVVLTIGNNSRGSIPNGITREFNFLIPLDGSGN